MRTYVVTMFFAVLAATLTVVEWGAIGLRMDAFAGALVLPGVILAGAFALFAWRGRGSGVKEATLRGWSALAVTAALLLLVPIFSARPLTAESLAQHGGWFAGDEGVLAPLGSGVERLAAALSGVDPRPDVSAVADLGDGTGETDVPPAGSGEVGDSTAFGAPDASSGEGALAHPAAQGIDAAGHASTVALEIADAGSGGNASDEASLEGSAESASGPSPVESAQTGSTTEVAGVEAVEALALGVDNGVAEAPGEDGETDGSSDVAVGEAVALIPSIPPVVVRDEQRWPSPAQPHAVSRTLEPDSLEALRDGVCALPRRERLRAAHDWIALNIEPLLDREREDALPSPEERAEWARMAFERREATSRGFAALFAELACGARAIVLSGGDTSFHRGEGPASYWNAVEVRGQWLIVDAAADAGCLPAPDCQRPYRSAHFLAPPPASVRTRIPSPASFVPYGDVDIAALLEGPAIGPEFFAAGLALESVEIGSTGFSVSVIGEAEQEIRAVLWDSGTATSVTCPSVEREHVTAFECPAVGPAGGRARLLAQGAGAWAWTELAAWRIR